MVFAVIFVLLLSADFDLGVLVSFVISTDCQFDCQQELIRLEDQLGLEVDCFTTRASAGVVLQSLCPVMIRSSQFLSGLMLLGMVSGHYWIRSLSSLFWKSWIREMRYFQR